MVESKVLLHLLMGLLAHPSRFGRCHVTADYCSILVREKRRSEQNQWLRLAKAALIGRQYHHAQLT